MRGLEAAPPSEEADKGGCEAERQARIAGPDADAPGQCRDAEADRGDLADQQTPKLKAMESALDKVRAKFGDAAIEKGLSLRDTRRRSTSSNRSPEADPDA